MSTDRVAVVEAALDERIATAPQASQPLEPDAPLAPGSGLTAGQARLRFEDMVRSRTLDVVARELKARGEGFYTISSAGHEANVVLGGLLRPTDPCLLHYRSGALMLARLRQVPGCDPVLDTLRSFVASREDPASGGRHKVWGSRAAWVPPQTSTIGSHLPKAVGTAFAIGRGRRLGLATEVPADAVAMCSFGDASLNHAAALAALNAARWARRIGTPLPLLFVCEDNGIGISVATPAGWVERTVAGLPGLRYRRASGELDQLHDAAASAIEEARAHRAPVFLHLETVRLWGHAGSDLEAAYRPLDEIRAAESADPVARAAARLLATGAATREELVALVAEVRREVRARVPEALAPGPLRTADEVLAPLAPLHPTRVRDEAARALPGADARRGIHPRLRLPEEAEKPGERTLAAHLNAALRDELLRRPTAVVFGEDIGRKGGVYGVTSGLQVSFGTSRVFDTLLDETSILGLAQGLGLLGALPVPEIQYLAYVHNALDQLRGEACSTAFFSGGDFSTPMVVRIASFAYQRGFGGHFHNDHAIGALRDIPGLIVAAPARGDDAVRMLRGCLAMAAVDGRVVAFLEPIALYHERDLLTAGDGGWLTDHPPLGEVLLPGQVGVHELAADGQRWSGEAGVDPDGDVVLPPGPGGGGPLHEVDVLLVTYANGLRLSLRAARELAAASITTRVVDLRWLSPLPTAAVERLARTARAVLVVDECRATGGGIADAVVAGLAEAGAATRVGSVRSLDSYVPLGPAADLVLLGEHHIVAAARALALGASPGRS